MAGSVVAVENDNSEKSVTAITDQFEVQYSRFFSYPSFPSAHPSLISISSNHRKRFQGHWISTSSSSTASLRLLSAHSKSGSVLIVTFRHKILEEHYILKLHFTWPQVSCISGFPARGSRVVFVSYKDSLGQIQKFALRFSSIYETEKFTNALKEILEDVRLTGLPSGNFGSEISSQSAFGPSNGLPYRPREDWSSMASADSCTYQMPISLEYEVAQNSSTQETAHNLDTTRDAEGILSSFPPSFTSLLMNCCPAVEQDAAQPSVSEEVDLKVQLARCLEDSSFQDILSKVEKVITEMGGDLML
ncbi:unnamed protein product [Ilex paraguariensis]|uniref:Poor homologous synapsis 1 PH domain-containing protein n=1 Tax=Ilex paraguariensis TaxID=185542 RepID=A0ABC8TW65_9AQUA